jgi:hypothetical protein
MTALLLGGSIGIFMPFFVCGAQLEAALSSKKNGSNQCHY